MADPSGVLRGVQHAKCQPTAENEHPGPGGATRCYHGRYRGEPLNLSREISPMTTDAQAIRHLWTHKTQDHPFLSDQELVIDRGRGSVDLDRAGQEAARRLRGPRGGQRGPRPARDRGGRSRSRRCGSPTTRPRGSSPTGPPRTWPRSSRPLDAGRPALHDVRGERVGGQRALDADRAAVLAGRGQVGQAQGHLTAGRLPRRHDGHVRGVRAAAPGPGLPAARGAGLREGGAAPSVPRPAGPAPRRSSSLAASASCARPSCAKGRTRSPR